MDLGENVMTAQHDSNSGANAENGQGAVSPSRPMPARRRILVRGAAAAVPTILTLRSGAALARSSNLMGVSDGPPADNFYRCVDERSFIRDGNQLDFGTSSDVEVTVIRVDGNYAKSEDGTGLVGGPEMCDTGGTFYSQGPETWNAVTVRRGALVSATALMSFAGRVNFNPTNI